MLIYFRELARNRNALIIWSLAMALFCVFLMTFYPTIVEQAEELDELMKQYPKELVEAFNLDRLRMSDPMGFYGGQVYIFITLFGSIYSMLLFSGVLSREENDGTIEFLATRSVTRNRILLSKSLAAFTYITLFDFSFGITNYILFEIYAEGTYDKKILLLLILGPWFMHVFFGSIALLLSVFITKIRSVYPLSIGVVLGSYFLSVLSSLSDSGENLKYLTAFKYVDAADIVENAGFTPAYAVIMASVVVICVILTWVFYNRKDMSVS